MPYYYWDPTYILVLIGALLSVGASALVNRTFNRYSSVYARSGLTGAQAAQKLSKKEEEEAPAPTTKTCPYCRSEIDIEAVKCPHCTSDITE